MTRSCIPSVHPLRRPRSISSNLSDRLLLGVKAERVEHQALVIEHQEGQRQHNVPLSTATVGMIESVEGVGGVLPQSLRGQILFLKLLLRC